MRVREAEDGDHGIADELFEDAAVLDDDFAGDVVIAAEQDADILGVERIAEGRRSRDVGKQDGDDPAFFSHDLLPLEEADAAATPIAGAAGYCLAAAATRNGRTILTVVLGSTQHFTDATTLLDFGFRHPVTH